MKLDSRMITTAGILRLAALAVTLRPAPAAAQSGYESYYLFLNDYPNEVESDWAQDAQGLTHDDDHWYITQTAWVWRIPVWHDLSAVGHGDQGVTSRALSSYSELVAEGYDHIGDPGYYHYAGQGYLLLPMEGHPLGLAVLQADASLDYIDHAFLTQNTSASWCAADPQGDVHTSDFDGVSAIFRYDVDWETLRNTGDLILSNRPSLTLRDETGTPTVIDGVQGGVFSPSGQLIYVVADGIHVFDTLSGCRVQRSTNGEGHFNYEYSDGFPEYEEPEGITIWDLDNGGAPGILGQLHALLLDNDWPGGDDVYLKHYTMKIYVDGTYGGAEDGRPWSPFNTVGEAYGLAWDGAEISIAANNYPENPTLSKRVRLTARGGTVRIGQ